VAAVRGLGLKARQQLAWSAAGLIVAKLLVAGSLATAADWPTYAHDQSRTGKTSEQLVFPLAESWSWKSEIRPQPIWDEPATWDGWNKVYDMRNRVDFDKAFHVAVVGNRVWYASSVEDKLFCVDLETGKPIWTFFAEAPIRLAPTVTGGKVYFGADDGRVYCLDASDGKLLWKKHLAPEDLRVAGNGRIISLWPVRTSVVVVEGECYACAGVFPSETVFLCAMDAASGESRWQTPIKDLPAQGYLLASPERLYVTAGRNGPIVFNRADGKRIAQVDTTGGTYALLAEDTLITTTGNDGRELHALGVKSRDRLATFRGHHMIVEGATFYLQDRNHLTAIDRDEYYALSARRIKLSGQRDQVNRQRKKLSRGPSTIATEAKILKLRLEILNYDSQIDKLLKELERCYLWRVSCKLPHTLILSGKTLIAGGRGQVAAFDTTDGRVLWQSKVDGNAYGLAVANNHLLVSTDTGVIHSFTPGSDSLDRQAPSVTKAAAADESVKADRPAGAKARIKPVAAEGPGRAVGPFIDYTAPDTIRVTWKTNQPAATRLEMAKLVQGKPGPAVQLGPEGERQEQDHVVDIPAIDRDAMYTYRVGGLDDEGQPAWTSWYRFDAMLRYPTFAQAKADSPYPENARTKRMRAAAKSILETAETQGGYALVLGATDGCLAYELASQSNLKVVVVEPSEENVRRIRSNLDQASMYGSRVAVVQGSLETIRFAPYFANIITSERTLDEGTLPGSFADVYHCLRPAGGLIWLAGSATENSVSAEAIDKWHGNAELAGDQPEWLEGEQPTWIYRRARLPGVGDWSHQYALPDNASCSRDDTIRGDMSVLWWGRPGARPMPDRGNRNPSPVSAGGRLYVQGDRTLFGMDAYNGTILWFQQIPTMRRTNIPRDGSNMVASDDILYLALGDRCVGLEGGTGNQLFDFTVPLPTTDAAQPGSYNWGYLAVIEDRVLGSAVRRGAQYLGDDGEWFEDFETAATSRVTSKNLFARDRHSGKLLWNYEGGVIINSTITASNELVWFIESRSDSALQAKSSRLFTEVLQDQYLVAVELSTGEVRWEHSIDLSRCQYMTYLCYSEGKLVMTGTDEDQHFHTYVYYAADGVPIWEHHAEAKKVHHSGKLDHPTIVGNRLYLNKHIYDLSSGKVIEVDEFDWHGCGVMSASAHTLFRRYEFHGMYDIQTKKRTEFLGLRSGCWLSLIPSGGLLLAPESSAGCSCGHSIQTSIAYVPKTVLGGTLESP